MFISNSNKMLISNVQGNPLFVNKNDVQALRTLAQEIDNIIDPGRVFAKAWQGQTRGEGLSSELREKALEHENNRQNAILELKASAEEGSQRMELLNIMAARQAAITLMDNSPTTEPVMPAFDAQQITAPPQSQVASAPVSEVLDSLRSELGNVLSQAQDTAGAEESLEHIKRTLQELHSNTEEGSEKSELIELWLRELNAAQTPYSVTGNLFGIDISL